MESTWARSRPDITPLERGLALDQDGDGAVAGIGEHDWDSRSSQPPGGMIDGRRAIDACIRDHAQGRDRDIDLAVDVGAEDRRCRRPSRHPRGLVHGDGARNAGARRWPRQSCADPLSRTTTVWVARFLEEPARDGGERIGRRWKSTKFIRRDEGCDRKMAIDFPGSTRRSG